MVSSSHSSVRSSGTAPSSVAVAASGPVKEQRVGVADPLGGRQVGVDGPEAWLFAVVLGEGDLREYGLLRVARVERDGADRGERAADEQPAVGPALGGEAGAGHEVESVGLAEHGERRHEREVHVAAEKCGAHLVRGEHDGFRNKARALG